MAIENPALNERSFQRGIKEAGAEPYGVSLIWIYVSVLRLLALLRARQ